MEDALSSFERGVLVDPSVLIHPARSRFLAQLSQEIPSLGPVTVLFPIAHLWALARADEARVHRYLYQPEEQLPLLANHSEPQSLRAVADWIRREPWIYSPRGRSLLREGLDSLKGDSWNQRIIRDGRDASTAFSLAEALAQELESRVVPLLSFSQVYLRLARRSGISVIQAPSSLSSTLFGRLRTSTLSHPRIILPLTAFQEGRSPFLKVLLEGAQISFG